MGRMNLSTTLAKPSSALEVVTRRPGRSEVRGREMVHVLSGSTIAELAQVVAAGQPDMG